jgi:hypothetical protein
VFVKTYPYFVVSITNLTKPVTRRGTLPFLHYGKPLIVTLEPGDVLAMRLEGDPTVHRAPLSQVYAWLCLRSGSGGSLLPLR